MPPAFQAQSATFVSVNQGWILGTAPCASPPCTSVVRTTDAGQHWVGIPAPRDTLSSDQVSGVQGLRFADPLDGWAYGPDLWSTHDGGASWNQLSMGPQPAQVDTLETAGGVVYAIVSHCQPGGGSCQPAQLHRSPVDRDSFAPVAGVSLPSNAPILGGLTLHGLIGYLVGGSSGSSGNTLWATTDGNAWSSRPNPCPADQALFLSSVAAVDKGRAVFLCVGNGAAGSTDKRLFASADNGRTFTPLPAAAPRGGDGGDIAAATASTFGLTTSSGAAWIYLTVDGGSSWTTALQLDDGGIGFGDFGFVDATHGVAVHAPATRLKQLGAATGVQAPATVFLTTNGGRAWTPLAF